MKITGIIWLRSVINKLAQKHQVVQEEVEEVFRSRPRFQRIARGDVAGEDLYSAMGQTDTGRYLIVFFILDTGDFSVMLCRGEACLAPTTPMAPLHLEVGQAAILQI